MTSMSGANSSPYPALRRRYEREALPHFDSLFGYALQLSGNSHQAEDLVQETFLRALRKFGQFRPRTSCRAWLFTICKNLFVDHARRRAHPAAARVAEFPDPATSDPPLEVRKLRDRSRGEEDFFGDELTRYLGELSGEFREALLLCDLDGLSYREIAQVMGTPVGTVRSRISRARTQLADRLTRGRDNGYE